MSHFRNDHNGQSEEELRHLEDEHEHERDPEHEHDPERERGGERERDARGGRRGVDPGELPSPLYRIKASHSNETFYAYFPEPPALAPKAAAAEPPAADLSAAADPGAAWLATEAGAPEPGQAAADTAVAAPPSPAAELPAQEAAAEASTEDVLVPQRTMVVAPTRYGKDLCELQGVVRDPGPVGLDEIVRIERIATEEDLRKAEANRERERKAFETCRARIAMRNLPMKLVSAHYLLEEPKVLFYFSAESRVDFRELVKDLVSVFKMRIELRQIGVRDEARVTGGCGVCGRVLCCHGVTDKLVPVSIKMAKDQNLSLNSMKISGPCGRLLCCLAYEYGFYRDARRELPGEGARFQHDGTLFRVIEVNALGGSVKAAGEDGRLLEMSAARFAYAEGKWQVRPEKE